MALKILSTNVMMVMVMVMMMMTNCGGLGLAQLGTKFLASQLTHNLSMMLMMIMMMVVVITVSSPIT